MTMDTNLDPDLARELAAVEEAWLGTLIVLTTKAGRIMGIQKLMYTYALMADMTPWGYGPRWCYRSEADARFYLEAWTGQEGTEPQGWFRAVDGTGRRRDDKGNEYIMP